uniref:Glycoside hydrolase family 5 n=1 Tax=uncultured bacterium contig00085 TaxID=1181558 RepID=A0A806KCV2_9BACT|nr:glycoside hydrolase family 5 [uncultured bacterium contig00085]
MKTNRFLTLPAILIALAFSSAFSQDGVTATVPVKANVNATVSIQPPNASYGTGAVHDVTAGVEEEFTLTLKEGSVPILQPQGLANAAVSNYSLFSLNGKQVWQGASISQANIAQGVYILSAKAANGKTIGTKLVAHNGGKLSAAFGLEQASSASVLRKDVLALSSSVYGEWTVKASAAKHYDTSYAFSPVEGLNDLQNITLRSVVPTAPEAMTEKTAIQYFTDEEVKAGWNLGNTLDAVNVPSAASETAWGNPKASQALFNGLKASGIDIVRIPCTWIGHVDGAPDYTISEARLKRVAEVVNMVHNAGMKAIINIHHDGNYTQPPNTWGFLKFAEVTRGAANESQVKAQLAAMWTQIANYFKNYGDYLIFETMNEVHSGNWGSAPTAEQDRLFDWNQTALSAIRATGGNNATRFVAVPGLGATEPSIVLAAHSRGKLLPNDGDNGVSKLIVSVHFYAPSAYTVASATPTQGNEPLRHTITTAELNAINTEAAHIKSTFIDNGIAVYYGEWGAPTNVRSAMNETVKSTHVDYISRVAAAAHANGIVPIIWDDGGDFKMLERSNGIPKTGLWADVLAAYMTAANGGYVPPAPVLPTNITGNLGNYQFGTQENGTDPDYTQALWNLSPENVTLAKQEGAKLVLHLSEFLAGNIQLVWQGPTNESWWNMRQILELTPPGNMNLYGTDWDWSTNTLTIYLSAAENYESFKTQPDLNLIIAYYGGSSVNDLGIISASLVE